VVNTALPCLVFDLDDTLCLERHYVRSGFDAVGEWVHGRLGIGDFADKAWTLFEAGQRRRIFDTLLNELGRQLTPSIIEEMTRVYRTHTPRIAMLPDAAECLAFFRGRALLALVTDGEPQSQRQKVEALRIAPFFHCMVLTGVWGNAFSKPHRRGFEFVQSRLRPDDGRFIYVADNPAKDFIAPAALGWQTVRVRRPQGLHAHCEARPGESATVEMSDLASLRDFIK
jgi:putative hydrolase of the HAD superfamily